MPSDALYQALAEALAKPNKNYQALQSAFEIPSAAMKGYEEGAKFSDAIQKRKQANMTLSEMLKASGAEMPAGTEGYGNLTYSQFEPTAKLLSGLGAIEKVKNKKEDYVPRSMDAILAENVRTGKMTADEAYKIKNRGLLLRGGYEEGEGGTLNPVPGGKPARDVAEAEAAKELGRQNQLRKAKLVINKIDEALSNMGPTTTGVIGSISRNVPLIPTKAKDLSGSLNTVKANISIDELTSMREASKTGGALGNVSDRENQMLADAAGALETEQTPEQLANNLKEIRKRYSNVRLIIENRTGDPEADSAIAKVISSDISEGEKRARIAGIRSEAGR